MLQKSRTGSLLHYCENPYLCLAPPPHTHTRQLHKQQTELDTDESYTVSSLVWLLNNTLKHINTLMAPCPVSAAAP